MTLVRRRHRAVYRVYSEDEYLAGVDPFADGDMPVAELTDMASHLTEQCVPRTPHVPAATVGAGTSRKRTLRRLAGAAALTGAVGTVGVTVGLVGLRSHPGDRQIAVAAVVSSPARTAPSIGGGPRVGMASSTRVTLRREAAHRIGAWHDGEHRGGTDRAPARGKSTRVARRAQGALHAGADVAAKAANARVAQAVPATLEQQPEQVAYTPVASTPQETSAPVASTAQSTPTETAHEPQAQSEFGFER